MRIKIEVYMVRAGTVIETIKTLSDPRDYDEANALADDARATVLQILTKGLEEPGLEDGIPEMRPGEFAEGQKWFYRAIGWALAEVSAIFKRGGDVWDEEFPAFLARAEKALDVPWKEVGDGRGAEVDNGERGGRGTDGPEGGEDVDRGDSGSARGVSDDAGAESLRGGADESERGSADEEELDGAVDSTNGEGADDE